MDITILLVYIVLALLTAIVYFVRRNSTYWQRRNIPCEVPHLLFGNMKGFRKTRTLEEIYTGIYKKFKGTGPFCGFYMFVRPVAFILDLQLAKNILIKDFANFADRGVFNNERDDPLSAHLFALDGAKWTQLRKKLSPTFTSGKMKFMFSTVVRVGDQFVEVFGDMLKQSSTVEIRELLARFTTDVIGTCAFGIECNSLKDPNAEFRIMGRKAITKFRYGNLFMAFVQGCPNLARKLRMRIITDDVQEFFMRIVRETIELREKNNVKRNDFMDLLVELKNSESIKTESGEVLTGLTVEEIAAQAFVFFIAGFETSSTTMGFALYELAKHTEMQQKTRDEINAVLSKYNGVLTYEGMKELHYMNQVISETLRLYTIVANLSRQALNDYVVPGHPNYFIEKGTRVLIPSSVYHHDPELYPEPFAFKPERFSTEMLQQRDSIQWLPFGDGPRNCIGLRFGLMQTHIGLVYLLKNFKFSVCPETQIPLKYDVKGFLLSVEGGIYLKVERI